MTAERDNKAFINWSGGKDAAFSLYRLRAERRYEISCLLTTLSEPHRRVSMHGVREELLARQAEAIQMPLTTLFLPENTGIGTYNDVMQSQLLAFAGEGITHAVFGDIFLDDVRKYREEQLALAGIKGVFPLWGENTSSLIHSFFEAGFKAVVTCVNARLLDRSFAGRLLDEKFISDLPDHVDPCGENGEFHSFVFDGPLFDHPISFSIGEIVEKRYKGAGTDSWDNTFFFCDLLP